MLMSVIIDDRRCRALFDVLFDIVKRILRRGWLAASGRPKGRLRRCRPDVTENRN
jgi:hypothetical protein